MSNYPDDIRNYDNDPRSPFYPDEPTCPHCDSDDVGVDVDCDEDGYYSTLHCFNKDCDFYACDDDE